MTRLQLSSTTRSDFSKSETKRIRREGGIPATIYGKNVEAKAVEVPAEKLYDILKVPGGRLSLIDMEIDGKVEEGHPVLIQDIQRDPVNRNILHVDFHRVSMNEPVHAVVPIVLTGEAPGTMLGGVLEQVITDLNVKALPGNIPTEVKADVSGLGLGDNIHVSDLKLPKGVELLHVDPESVVATVHIPAGQVAAEAAEVAEAEGEKSE